MIISEMEAKYVDHMGCDLDVVDAARVSFHKESDWADEDNQMLTDSDAKLIAYLAKHNHWSPFAHCTVKFRVKAPIFVARQLMKHTVGFSWNEVSRRYVDDGLEFYMPDGFRAKADSVKQGSSADIIPVIGGKLLLKPSTACEESTAMCLATYELMIRGGVCPEQARMVLPQNTMTEWIWTGTLFAWARMCQLRLDSHTQKETREVAKMITKEMQTLFPVSWKALMFDEKKEKVCALLS